MMDKDDLPKIKLRILDVLEKNFLKSGNPLGLKIQPFFDKLGITCQQDKTILYTGLGYQLMPYTLRLLKYLDVLEKYDRMVYMLSNLGLTRLITPQMEDKFYSALQGAVAALKSVGYKFGCLRNEPYDGAIFYDLGLDHIVDKNEKIIRTEFEKNGVERVITISPHTYYMLKKVYSLNVDVIHIYEILYGRIKCNKKAVIHDPCVLARKMGIISQLRIFNAIEPENSKEHTSCCGGPIEILFPKLSLRIAKARGEELMKTGADKIATACPICLMNFLRAGFEAEDILSLIRGESNEVQRI